MVDLPSALNQRVLCQSGLSGQFVGLRRIFTVGISESGGVRHHAVTAVAFGTIEGLVGTFENGGSIIISRRQCRDTDRDRDLQVARTLLDRKWLAGDAAAQA